MNSTQGNPTTPNLTNAVIVDVLTDVQSMSDLAIIADQYRDEGIDVFYALNPSTGRTCLWRAL